MFKLPKSLNKSSSNHIKNLHCLIPLIPLIVISSGRPYSPEIWSEPPPFPDDTYFYSDYKLPSPSSSLLKQMKSYTPSLNSHCQETGKTLCKDVDQYPIDVILEIVKSAKSANFNFTSIFSDESVNQQEPVFNELERFSLKGLKKNETKLVAGKMRSSSNINSSTVTGHSRRGYQSSSLSSKIFEALKGDKQSSDKLNGTGSSEESETVTGRSNQTLTLPVRTKQVTLSSSEKGQQRKQQRVRRVSSSKEELTEEVCAIRSMYITPRAALNDRSEWKYIVNLGDRDSRLRQIIKVDVCSKPGSPCSSTISLPFGYKTRCKQKYIKKKLLALDINGQTTSTDNFFVPSCCACEIFRDKASI